MNKYKLVLISMIMAAFILLTSGCGISNALTTKRKSYPTIIDDESEYSSILSDKKFKRGFIVRGLGYPIYPEHAEEETYGPMFDTGYMFQYGKEDLDKPVWEICQWATRYAFHDESLTKFMANGTEYTYENPTKFFRVNTSTGEFTLGLEGKECYVYGDRDGMMEWPHLLISRDINKSALTKISDKSEIRITLDASLDRYEDWMTVEPHIYKHAAQCMFYLYVANFDENTQTFTDMLWLGLSIFDNRYEFTEEFAKQDTDSKESQTNKFIYNVASSEYFSKTNNFYKDGKISVGSNASVNFDILPYVKTALEKAQDAGCMLESKYENLYINGMYIGFELPGTYNLEMSFKNMDIKVK